MAYTLPSLNDLFETDSLDSFSNHFVSNNNNESIGFDMHVYNEADKTTISCPEN